MVKGVWNKVMKFKESEEEDRLIRRTKNHKEWEVAKNEEIQAIMTRLIKQHISDCKYYITEHGLEELVKYDDKVHIDPVRFMNTDEFDAGKKFPSHWGLNIVKTLGEQSDSKVEWIRKGCKKGLEFLRTRDDWDWKQYKDYMNKQIKESL